jgi:hypothetical protein
VGPLPVDLFAVTALIETIVIKLGFGLKQMKNIRLRCFFDGAVAPEAALEGPDL